jgi:hypothetical protein
VKKGILILLILLALGATSSLAESNIQIFFVACADQAVINLSGTIDPGYDVFYQVFSAAGGGGSAISAQRRAVLDGTVAFSERLPYNAGTTVSSGVVASVRVVVGREDNPAASTIDTTVDDVQDGCADPQNPLGTSQDASIPTTTEVVIGPPVVSPFGGFLNPDLEVAAEPIVVIGARQRQAYRSPTPGLIFAECTEALPQATPGIIYDTDNVVIFWSWFARTEQQVQDHINNAIYEVTLNRQPFFDVVVSPISKRGPNFFVFYTAQVGNLRPGTYGVQYRVTWETVINDGFADYGPGTDNTQDAGDCQFTITSNPVGGNPRYNLMYSLPVTR